MDAEWDALWNEQSRLMDRMMDHARKEAVEVTRTNMIRIRLSVKMLWRVFWGGTLLFTANEKTIEVKRS